MGQGSQEQGKHKEYSHIHGHAFGFIWSCTRLRTAYLEMQWEKSGAKVLSPRGKDRVLIEACAISVLI